MGNDVLILDEVTSNMDGRSERLFYQALLKLRGRAVGPATFYLHYGTIRGGFFSNGRKGSDYSLPFLF